VWLLLQLASLVLAQPAPHSGARAGGERPGEAFDGHRAAAANGLSPGQLGEGWPGGADGKEQLRILGAADRARPPVHVDHFRFAGIAAGLSDETPGVPTQLHHTAAAMA
jgi:hypothetical protein